MIEQKQQEVELTATFIVKQEKPQLRVEECHGTHTFDDAGIEVYLESVFVDVFGQKIDITRFLSESAKKQITENFY